MVYGVGPTAEHTRRLVTRGITVYRLTRNCLIFGRLLRSLGLPMTAGREMEFLRALQIVDVGRRADVYHTARSLFVSHRDHVAVFDRAFDLFFTWLGAEWRPPDASESSGADNRPDGPEAEEEGIESESISTIQMKAEAAASPVAPEKEEEREARGDEQADAQTYSAIEVLRNKDFDRYTPEEQARVRDLMRQLRLRPSTRRTRRKVPSPHGQHLDMRAVVRGMYRTGGEPIVLSFRRQKLKRRKLVLICDISGSMERYSRVLLQFLHGARQGMRNVEVFVFGTRLTRVTRDLGSRQVDAALDHISRRVQDFAGGTRIGRSLHDFNRTWARRVLGQSAVCILISDGWDRGDPRILRQEMEHLQRTSFRLIWLNPLLGLPEYQPVTLGMRTALEFVDDFMPAHNLASLENLARRLSALEARRPVRRQNATAPLPAGIR
ncbi:MAG: VWA domain-containing protein [Chloroflexi bacterium]|nr:VWA domain-containing protein [Chloroflexota bacterium]